MEKYENDFRIYVETDWDRTFQSLKNKLERPPTICEVQQELLTGYFKNYWKVEDKGV